jgi:hypothetical protein
LLCLFAGKVAAQDNFETKAKVIANKISAITKEEKDALKKEVEAVNQQLDNKTITKEQADEQKIQLAQTHAKNIETRVAAAQAELDQLVKDQVDGKLAANDSVHSFSIKWTRKKDKDAEKDNGESRTTSQLVFALGANNIVTGGAVANSDFRYWGSHFYELGLAFSTRLFRNDNLLHARYGLSLQYNNLRPTDNRYFVENGNRTDLETSAINLRDSRFHNVNLVVPVHLEFDFSGNKTDKDGKAIFKTHQTFRFGLGGYAGINVKSKQILKFDDDQDNAVTQKTKGDFNVNDFIYGLSAYIGYRDISLYAKYDLNPLFSDNPIAQRNVSMGIRWDWN